MSQVNSGERHTGEHADPSFTPTFIKYGYNDRSEMTSAKWYAGNDPGVTTSPVTGRQFEYTFDPIGNRLTHSDGTLEPRTYSHNNLNQLTQSEADGSFAYDPDGNMTVGQTNLWNYRYDAENRLVEAWQPGGVNGKRRILHTYDYLGRRVRSQTFTRFNGAWSTLNYAQYGGPNFDHLFVYDGWNPLIEIGREWLLEDEEDPQAAPQYRVKRRYAWGADLSGGLSGMRGPGAAGGVGGLLGLMESTYWEASTNGTPFEDSSSNTVWPNYDGLGNVMQIVDASTQGFSGSYAYYPFGGVLSLAGPSHSRCRFRFSTKYMPWVSDQYDYGYRWLFPRIGRWGSRDVIGESDGPNVYRFLKNSPPVWLDPLGLAVVRPTTHVAIECSDVMLEVRGASILLGRHCSVVADCGCLGGLRWEDGGGRAGPGEGVPDQSGHPENAENDRKKERPIDPGWLDLTQYPHNTGWERYSVNCSPELCPCDIFNCLKTAIRRANLPSYNPLWRNSNTFARALLEKCGCKLQPRLVRMHPQNPLVPYAEQFKPVTEPDNAVAWNRQYDYWNGWTYAPCSSD